MNQNQLITNKNLMALFKKFDKDGNGIIESAEIAEVLKENGEREYTKEQIDQILQEAGASCPGEISFEEFVVMMKNLK